MIIAKHRDGGIYVVYFTGLMKMDDGKWDNAVIYKRLNIDLKSNESTSEVYVRQASSFKENFEHLTWQEFHSIAGKDFDIPEIEGNFSGIFG